MRSSCFVFTAFLGLVVSGSTFSGCKQSQKYDLDGGDLLHLGATYVAQRQCANCHQDTDTRVVLAGKLTPVDGTTAWGANLTPDRDTGLGKWADIEVVRAIRFGIDADGAELCPTMPRFSDMGDLEARAIVAYLRSLPAVSRDIPESNCPPVKPPPPPDLSVPPPPPDLTPPAGDSGPTD